MQRLTQTPRQPMLHELMRFGNAHTLDGDRHHDAGEARARLSHLERIHRLPRAPQLRRQLRQPRRDARLRRITAKLRAKRRIHQQPLDQLAGTLGFLIIG